MNEIRNLYDAGVAARDALPLLEQALSAFTVALEAMDDDGIQPEGKRISAAASILAKRFPMYSGTLHLILRDMWATLDLLQTGVDSIFEASRKQQDTKESPLDGAERPYRNRRPLWKSGWRTIRNCVKINLHIRFDYIVPVSKHIAWE